MSVNLKLQEANRSLGNAFRTQNLVKPQLAFDVKPDNNDNSPWKPLLTTKPLVAEVKKLLAEGFDRRPSGELVKLLGHADMRVRQECSLRLLIAAWSRSLCWRMRQRGRRNLLARLHAIWGLGQLGRRGEKVRESLRSLLSAPTEAGGNRPALGWLKEAEGRDLIPLLKDAEPRVCAEAARSLGRPNVAFQEPG